LEVRGRTFILIDKNGIRFSEIDRFKKNRRKGKRG